MSSHLTLNAFIHAPSCHTQNNPSEIQREGIVSCNQLPTRRGIHIVESHPVHNALEHNPGYRKNHERFYRPDIPVDFNAIGIQSHVMRDQTDMFLQRQHIMPKQMLEIQRRDQFHQIKQKERQENQFCDLPCMQLNGTQPPSMFNGNPDMSNYMWQGHPMGGKSNISNPNSGTNTYITQHSGSPSEEIPNGLISSSYQSGTLHSMDFYPQQSIQTLSGIPVGNAGGDMHSNSYFHGVTNLYDLSSKEVSGQASTTLHSDREVVFSGLMQGKDFFVQASMENLNNGVDIGNVPQEKNFLRSNLVQEFSAKHEQSTCCGNVPETSFVQARPSQNVESPGEDQIWNYSLRDDQLDHKDSLTGFPTVQTGTWSALMQYAMAETSNNETGLHDEWTDPRLQKSRLLTSPSKPFSFFSENMSSVGHNLHYFSQSGYKKNEHLDHIHDFDIQTPSQAECIFSRAWASPMLQPTGNGAQSTDVRLNIGLNMQDSCSQRQTLLSPGNTIIQTHAKPPNRNVKEMLLPYEDESKELSNDDFMQETMYGGNLRDMQMERDIDVCQRKNMKSQVSFSLPDSNPASEKLKSRTLSPSVHNKEYFMSNFNTIRNSHIHISGQEINIPTQDEIHLNYGPFASVDPSLKCNGSRHVKNDVNTSGEGNKAFDKKMHNPDNILYDMQQKIYAQKGIASESSPSTPSRTGKHAIIEGGVGEEAWRHPNKSYSFVSGNQRLGGTNNLVPTVSRKFQYHPMGDLEINNELKIQKQDMKSECIFQPSAQRSRNQQHPNSYQPECIDPLNHVIEKNHLFNLQRKDKEVSGGSLRASVSSCDTPTSSLNGLAAVYAPTRAIQASNNMLKILPEGDQSRNIMTRGVLVDSSSARLSVASTIGSQRSQEASSPQGFGLQLGLPSERRVTSNKSVFSHMIPIVVDNHTIESRRDLEMKSMDRQQLSPSPSSPSHGISSEDFHTISHNAPKHTQNEMLYSDIQETPSLMVSSDISFARNQLYQHNSTNGACQMNEQSIHFSLGNHSHLHTNESSQTSSSQSVGKMSSICSSSLFDHVVPSSSHMYLNDHCNLADVKSIHLRNQKGKQHQSMENIPILQSFLTPGLNQNCSSSPTLPKNVWKNTMGPQLLSEGLPQKVHVFFQSTPNGSNPYTSTKKKMEPENIRKEVSGPSQFVVGCVNSEEFLSGNLQSNKENSSQTDQSKKVDPVLQLWDISQGQELPENCLPCTNNATSGPSNGQLHQNDLSEGRYEPDQAVSSNVPTKIILFPSSKLSSDLHPPLHVQTLNCGKIDYENKDKRNAKGCNDSVQFTGEAGLPRGSTDIEQGFIVSHSSSENTKLLPFSSEGKTVLNINTVSKRSLDVMHSKSGYVDQGNLLTTENPTYQKFSLDSIYDNTQKQPSMEKVIETNVGQVVNIKRITPDAETPSSPMLSPCEYQNLTVMRPKKRKIASLKYLSWSKEISQGSKLRSIGYVSEFSFCFLFAFFELKEGGNLLDLLTKSICFSATDLDWSKATNQVPEKLEDEYVMIDDDSFLPRSLRRLILTTKLMQQLFCSLPSSMLSQNATLEHESIVYVSSKLALGDACSLISCPDSPYNVSYEKVRSIERVGDFILSKLVEGFSVRSRKLENELLSLEKRLTMSDIRVECKDLENFFINCFGRFHDGSNANAFEDSSSSNPISRKVFLQKHVTVLPMPPNLPKDVACFSL